MKLPASLCAKKQKPIKKKTYYYLQPLQLCAPYGTSEMSGVKMETDHGLRLSCHGLGMSRLQKGPKKAQCQGVEPPERRFLHHGKR
jgi:hypothetical protein